MVGLQDRTSRLPWDNFVPDEADSNVHLHIDRFRESEWPNIVRELAKEPYNIVLPEGLEPHWVAPGKAVYWSERIVREVVEKEEYGISKRVLEDVSHGWFPASEEHGLPANNASTKSLKRKRKQKHMFAGGMAIKAVPSKAGRVMSTTVLISRNFWKKKSLSLYG